MAKAKERGIQARNGRSNPNDPNSKIIDDRNKAMANPKGRAAASPATPRGETSTRSGRGRASAFQQAVQEAPEALDRQRIPADAADIARKYFSKLGNQKE